MSRPAADTADTRERLIAAALSVLSRGGIEHAPVRQINRAAGVRHQSAVYYHFGDRWGLVEAVLDHATGEMLAEQDRRLRRIEAGEEAASVAAIFAAFVEPTLAIAAGETGRERLLFTARLLDEAGSRGQALVAARVRPIAARAERLLLGCLPGHDAVSVSARMLYALNALLHTLADRGMQRHWGLGEVDKARLVAELMAFLEGGLRHAPAPNTNEHDREQPTP